MNDMEGRLSGCFLNVFPDLEPGQVAGASTDTVAAWDSVAQITLLSAVSEEFGIEFEPDAYADLVSYDQLRMYLKNHASAGA